MGDYEDIKKQLNHKRAAVTAGVSIVVVAILAVTFYLVGASGESYGTLERAMLRDLGIENSKVAEIAKDNGIEMSEAVTVAIRDKLIEENPINEEIVDSYVAKQEKYAYVTVWPNLDKNQAEAIRDQVLAGTDTDIPGTDTVVKKSQKFAASAFNGAELYIESDEAGTAHSVVRVNNVVEYPDNYLERLAEASELYTDFLYINYENKIINEKYKAKSR